jgi:hypothetical protein
MLLYNAHYYPALLFAALAALEFSPAFMAFEN